MKHKGMKKLLTLMILLCISLLTACGGGGGGGGDGDGSGDGVVSTVTGTVSKGPVAGATVAIYAMEETGAKGELLAEATTDQGGAYLAELTDYEGPILAEASGGSYLDEGSGQTLSIPEDAPLRAVHPAASGDVTLHVSGLTELAVRVAEVAGLSAGTVAEASEQLSEVFGFDLVTTAPVAPVAAALAGASEDEVDYALTLATLSQLAFDWNLDFDVLLAELADELAAEGVLSAATLAGFDAAAAALLDPENPANATGLASAAGTGLPWVGRVPATLTLSVAGDLPPGSVGGLQFVLVLPEEAFAVFDGEGAAAVTMVAGSDPFSAAFYGPEEGTISMLLLSLEGLGSGEVATVELALVMGAEVGAEDFAAEEVQAFDPAGVELSGVSIGLELADE
ncbi:hypothetical protein [uncultured Desulfuromonas sp.]|uniref:hypothetical protein n=1 Tax=uncultured Desulfuromonas sp. TaxID=181013 RepID=UPI002631B383|nr:hypothetical protein [uncultured Desulfuromonas sp.]